MSRQEENALKEIAAKIDAPKLEPVVEEVVNEPVEVADDTSEPSADVHDSDSSGDNTDNAVDDGDIKTISQLAKAIEVEPEYLYGMEIGMGDNEDAIPLGKLKDEYQASLKERAELQSQLDSQNELLEKAQSGVNHQQQLSNESQQVQVEMLELNNQYNSIDWAKYEQDDPGAAALARQKFQEAGNHLSQRIGQANQQQQIQQQQTLQNAATQLTQLIPAWQDSTVREQGVAKVKSALLEAGYTPDMIKGASDYRAIALMHELVGYRERDKQAKDAVSKVRSAPKVLKGHGRVEADMGRQTNDLVTKAKSTRNKHDEMAAVKSILKIK